MKNGHTMSLNQKRTAPGRKTILALVAVFLFMSAPTEAAAAQRRASQGSSALKKETYIAQKMLQSERELTLAPNEARAFTVAFKNNGSAAWKNSGPGFVSAYTYNPKYRRSQFQDTSWRNFRQAALMKTPEAKPGELGFFEVILRAPKTPGTYQESFALAAEDAAWIEKSHFIVPITVTAAPTVVVAPPPARVPSQAALPPNATDFQALRLSQSAPALTMKAGEVQQFRILFKNVGMKVWLDEAVKVRETSEPLTIATQTLGILAFKHDSWSGEGMPVFKRQEIIPGEVSMNEFAIRAPETPGQYVASFMFLANGTAAAGGDFDIPITVTDDAGNVPEGAQPLPATGAIPEPNIRIGLYTTDAPIIVVATEPLEVRTADGNVLGSADRGTTVTLAYIPGGGYRATLPNGQTVIASSPIRLVPTAPAVLTITNYQNHPRWSSRLNDNAFRGSIELLRNSKGSTWVVNELPIEHYLRGLAETGNGSPSEYHKAIIVAARTYAYWHELYPNKHEDFTIDAYWDQVYRGYNSEIRMQNFVASVEDTRGTVITYQNDLVVTPYYARSDGRTRSWQEVWHGTLKPWLVSVTVPWDAGSRMLGHGVGMSATAAAEMAKEGKAYPEIIKYFYTGTDLKKLW